VTDSFGNKFTDIDDQATRLTFDTTGSFVLAVDGTTCAVAGHKRWTIPFYEFAAPYSEDVNWMHKRSVLAALDDPATGNLTKYRARR
jgi:hypothetical protein